MKKIKIHTIVKLFAIFLILNSCIEPFDIKTIKFESSLVIEARITNEVKQHEVKLSRTFKLEEKSPSFERGANVKVIDDAQVSHQFTETTPGIYTSVLAFSANPNTKYQLLITTQDGKSYASEETQLTAVSKIENVYAERVESDESDQVNIFVDSFDPNGASKYYRYEYEETYKIIAPLWARDDLKIVGGGLPPPVALVVKTREERICYNTVNSTAIIQTETNGLTEDRVTKFPVKLISSENAILAERYSIVVKQYVQSPEAYTYYKILNSLSDNESLLSQKQQGFFNGNIYATENTSEKVIGFFDVSSVSSFERVYFNRDDFYLGTKTPFFSECFFYAPEEFVMGRAMLAEAIEGDDPVYKYYQDNTDPTDELPGPYILTYVTCGDCTKHGTNIKPAFWQD